MLNNPQKRQTQSFISPLFRELVWETLDQKDEEASAEDALEDSADAVADVAEDSEAEDAEVSEIEMADSKEDDLKCMKLLAISAENNAKFLSSHQEISLSFAVIALEKKETLEMVQEVHLE